jgi:hypothetical protein
MGQPSSRQVCLKPASPDSGHFSPDKNPSSSVTTTGPKSRLSHRLLFLIEIRPDRAALLFRDPVVELPT